MLDRIWHPFGFAVFPILFLVQYNVRYLTLSEAIWPLAISLSIVTVLYLIGRRIFKDKHVLGLRLTILAIWFFAYGHVEALYFEDRFETPKQAHAAVFPVWTIVAIVLIVAVRYLRGRTQITTRFLNAMAIVMVLVSAGGIGAAIAQGTARPQVSLGEPPFATVKLAKAPTDAPSIYYLVFDRYAGAETLEEVHHYDNSPFLDDLGERGFAVHNESRGNYPSTVFSLASSMNLEYLDSLKDYAGRSDGSFTPVLRAVQLHSLGRSLQAAGYRYLHIGSWWEGTRTSTVADHNYPMYPLTEFERTFYDSTAMAPLLANGLFDSGDLLQLHHDISIRQFNAIEDAATKGGPKFVFAHVLLPHPPYVFERDGKQIHHSPKALKARRDAYIEQLIYTNRQILDTVDHIVKDDPDAVVVIQSDEGPNPSYWSANLSDWTKATDAEFDIKYRVLNAYRFPNADTSDIPDDISPVNTFRFIFDTYLGADLPLLPDESYASSKASPYDFVAVSDRIDP